MNGLGRWVDEEGRFPDSFTRMTQLAALEIDAYVPSSGFHFLLERQALEDLRLGFSDRGPDPPSLPLESERLTCLELDACFGRTALPVR